MLTKTIIGVLELTSKYRYGVTSRGIPIYLFTPYDETLPHLIVGCSLQNPQSNYIAAVSCPVANLASGEATKPRGTLLQLLGPVGDPAAEEKALLQHYCPTRQKPKAPVPDPDTVGDNERSPLDADHGWTTFHIDPPGCLDIDDALAYHQATDRWAITIADAAAAVPADSEIDDAAREIGATFYDLEGSARLPMLPRQISEESASLRPGQKRRGVTLFLNANGKPDGWALTWITVTESYTYDSVKGTPIGHLLRSLFDGEDSHVWVERAMLLYNTEAAKQLRASGHGILRSQAATEVEEARGLAAIDPALANEAALYAPAAVAGGHATLGCDSYAHASSPLRRYADLENQRVLKALIREEPVTPVSTTADHLNERQRANRRWSRDLTFLAHVTPGLVHRIDVVWTSPTQVWIPAWRRLIRLRHDPPEIRPTGIRDQIEIFCDPTQRNWKRRILTAPVVPTLAEIAELLIAASN